MTFFDWVTTDQGQRFAVALVGTIAALGAWLRSRSTGKRVDTVHTLVNGAATQREARISQLENFIVNNGLALPPSPSKDPETDIANLIPPPRQGT